jgi:threonine synthase
MNYISTRGNSPKKKFTEILLGGLAPDGGLYLPNQYPQITRTELDAWRELKCCPSLPPIFRQMI